jgi:hypothetical protein
MEMNEEVQSSTAWILKELESEAIRRGLDDVVGDDAFLERTRRALDQLATKGKPSMELLSSIAGGEALAFLLWTSGACDVRMVSRHDGSGINRLCMRENPSIVLANVALTSSLINLAYEMLQTEREAGLDSHGLDPMKERKEYVLRNIHAGLDVVTQDESSTSHIVHANGEIAPLTCQCGSAHPASESENICAAVTLTAIFRCFLCFVFSPLCGGSRQPAHQSTTCHVPIQSISHA